MSDTERREDTEIVKQIMFILTENRNLILNIDNKLEQLNNELIEMNKKLVSTKEKKHVTFRNDTIFKDDFDDIL